LKRKYYSDEVKKQITHLQGRFQAQEKMNTRIKVEPGPQSKKTRPRQSDNVLILKDKNLSHILSMAGDIFCTFNIDILPLKSVKLLDIGRHL